MSRPVMRPAAASPLAPGAFIAANLPLDPVPGVPEIRLHRARPSSGLHRLSAADPRRFGSPYWAYAWPGGLALARHVLDRPELVAGRRVLDLGAGSGLVAIAAAKAGARSVLAAEIDRFGLAALGLNAAANGADVTPIGVDLVAGGSVPPVDVVLVGDLFYAKALARRVTAALDRWRADGLDILVGDPGRADLPLSRLRLLAEYPVTEVGAARADATGGVYAFDGVPTDERR